jgi:hypothetical protein
LTVTACNHEPEEKEEEKEATTLTVNASAFDGWKYVSFVQGKEVEISDYQSALSWDIAFHRMDVRLNGGESGKGQGAGLQTNYKQLNEVTTFPASGYIADVMDSINIEMQVKEAQPKNLTVSSWISMAGMPPKYTVSDYVYVVKTAEGKHVKIKFLDYLNAENKGGYIKFSYVYMD